MQKLTNIEQQISIRPANVKKHKLPKTGRHKAIGTNNAYSHNIGIYTKDVYFIFQSTQKFLKSIQMTYLHKGRMSEAQYFSTPNGSSSDADSS
jgi:hypothetical protein